jgi:hypothetical protein
MELHQDKSPGEQQVLSSYNAHKHEDTENAWTEIGKQANGAKNSAARRDQLYLENSGAWL